MKELFELERKQRELYKQIHEIEAKMNNYYVADLKNRYKNRYIHFKNGFHEGAYMKVSNIWYSKSNDTIFIEGMSFYGETGEYRDMCDFSCACWNQLEFKRRTFQEFNIQELSEKEFKEIFDEKMYQTRIDFERFMNKKYEDK
jgi:hypothetical protein